MGSLKKPAPILAADWADENFWLSGESSYAQGRWITRPYQRPILNTMCDLSIPFVDWQKPSRVGATKLLVIFHLFNAAHRSRNQIHYQPTDGDATHFVKAELDTALRDAKVGHVFPWANSRDKHNTVDTKIFLNGCMMHIRGAKAAVNFRRLTGDDVSQDELSGCDSDVENEGSPDALGAKRTEGALFPKYVSVSTPKIKGACLMEARRAAAQLIFHWHTPCPECGEMHRMTWERMTWEGKGGADAEIGDDAVERERVAATVRHACPHCGSLYRQADYLRVWEAGRMIAQDGTWICPRSNNFYSTAGDLVQKPKHVRFEETWTGISDHVAWPEHVKAWLLAKHKAEQGDDAPLKHFINTTLARTYEEDLEGAEPDTLRARAEDFPLRRVPLGGLVLTAGVDVQADRFEVVVYAWGKREESWTVDYTALRANPADEDDWDRVLLPYLQSSFAHAGGQRLGIEATSIDTGYATHQAYSFCRRHRARRVFAIKGLPKAGMPIKGRSTLVDVNYKGKMIERGISLWFVGTDPSKDLLYSRLKLAEPGPGYMHLSKHLPPDYFDQMGSERRTPFKHHGGIVFRYQKVHPSARKEVPDATRYAIHAAHMLDLHRYTDSMWQQLVDIVQPSVGDLFAQAPSSDAPAPAPAPEVKSVFAPRRRTQRARVLSRGVGL